MGSVISAITSSLSTPPPTMAQVQEVNNLIKSDRVVIFSKTYCPYCKLAKEVFLRLKQKVTCIELDEMDDGAALQQALAGVSSCKTVPQVFIDGKFIGGGSDVKKMEENGSLQPLLAG